VSEENVETLRSGLNAWAQSGYGPETFQTAVFDPDIEWDVSDYPLPDWTNVGSGRERFQELMRTYVSGWQDYRAEPRDLVDAQDEVVMALHETVAMGGSAETLERDLHQVWKFREGVVVKIRVFRTRTQALEAAGLSE